MPPPMVFSFIPTYMNPKVTTTMQPTSSVIPSLGISASISNTFMPSHIIYPTTLPPIIIPLTFPLYTHTPLPFSPPSRHTRNDSLINHLIQTIVSLQNKFSTMNLNNHGLPTFYVRNIPLSLEILRMPMPQGIEIHIFEKYNGKGDPTSHVNAFTTLCSDFFLNEKLLDYFFLGP
jgi:hypothetical protein